MTKEQKALDKQVNKILDDLDTLKCSIGETLEGFEAEDTDTYDDMFDALYKKVEALRP